MTDAELMVGCTSKEVRATDTMAILESQLLTVLDAFYTAEASGVIDHDDAVAVLHGAMRDYFYLEHEEKETQHDVDPKADSQPPLTAVR